MHIRGKLLILLLAIALLPLGLVSLLENRTMQRFGYQLGGRAREALIDQAGRQLARVAEVYAWIVDRDRETIELILRVQASNVEQCLADAPPEHPVVYWAADYDQGVNLPAAMQLSDKHIRVNADGQRIRVPVTYEQQVLVLAPGVDRAAVADDVARLSQMAAAYKVLAQGPPELIQWNYTALASGVHSSYPGHGGYPPAFDPRRRAWYQRALEQDDLTWSAPMVDASTGDVVVTVSMPVRGPDGAQAGVTAIDIRLADLVQGAAVPEAWSAQARSMLVFPDLNPATGSVGGLIIAQQSYLHDDRNWDEPIDLEWLASSDTEQLAQVLADLQAGRAGLRQMPYAGHDSLWAYSPVSPDTTTVLLIVPYAGIVAQAEAAKAEVLALTRRNLQIATLVLAVVAVLVVIVAFRASRTVTRPVAELADAARRIAAGDLKVHTHVHSRDELGALSQAFNDMLPKLADRLRLRDSLALAMQVQQRLLPGHPPKVTGLDVAGKSIYCDETGGDYYDFLQLSQFSPCQLGVAVGDVTGHGISAALLMATGRAMLRSRLHGTGGLADVFTHMNEQLAVDTDGSRFMTLVYLLIDTQTRTLRWVSAGHDPAITYQPDTNTFDELVGGGLPLGVEEHWEYEEFSCPAAPRGQIIVIGTDGIWEAHNPAGEMFGKDRLRDVIRAHAKRSAEDISRAITKAVATFRDTQIQEDDITLVVAKLAPQRRT